MSYIAVLHVALKTFQAWVLVFLGYQIFFDIPNPPTRRAMQSKSLTAFLKFQSDEILTLNIYIYTHVNNLNRSSEMRFHNTWIRKSTIHSTYKSTYSRFSCLAGHYTAVQHWSVELCKILDSACLLSFEGALSDMRAWYGVMPLDSWTVREKHSSEERLQQLENNLISLHDMPRNKDIKLMLHLIKQWARKLGEPKKDMLGTLQDPELHLDSTACWRAYCLCFPSFFFFSCLNKVTATSHLMFPLYSN